VVIELYSAATAVPEAFVRRVEGEGDLAASLSWSTSPARGPFHRLEIVLPAAGRYEVSTDGFSSRPIGGAYSWRIDGVPRPAPITAATPAAPPLSPTPPPSTPPAGPAAPAGWVELAPAGSGLAVLLPGQPAETVADVPDGAGGTTRVRQYKLATADREYTVAAVDSPSFGRTAPERLLDETRDRSLRKAGGTLQSETAVQVGGHPGRDWTITSPGGVIVRCRAAVVGSRLIHLTLVAPDGAAARADADAFLASLRL
jgi:hypothetical protein